MSQALLTDLYQLTMAYGYWRSGKAGDEAAFHLIFRENPFGGGYTIAAGLETAIRYLDGLRFDESDLDYVRSLALFDDDFITLLRSFEFGCDVDAIPEGTVVFPQEPLVRVRGPIMQAQLVESALLNVINFQSLIATKASRVVHAAKGDMVLDFGLRRAQGMDGANSASRAAYVGGCHATSNTMAGALHGIPVRGTHAHSWVMAFPSELEAFETWAEVMPHNAVLLVDTYDTLGGVRHAIDVAKAMRARGRELQGIRLDSGDLATLSIEARQMLDDAGFPKVLITASNDLDEHLIAGLKERGARVDVWGVGTRLITAYDQPALGGVYKLTAIRPQGGAWQHRIKLSEQDVKISTPGILQVRRFEDREVIWDELTGSPKTNGEDLLVPIYRGGKRVYDPPPLDAVRRRREEQFTRFSDGIKRFENPHLHPVELEPGLFDLKARLIAKAREAAA
jgi:nicotinate phosphoribosyltransferase